MDQPQVSAVIPTRNRSELVCRAVRSVLSQTFEDLECIVVIDGPDPATVKALEGIHDSRLKVLALRENVGGCEARNTGARAASGKWIALLDDDDEWLPEKLEKQLKAAATSTEIIMVVSRFFDRGANEEIVRPRIFPSEGQLISEFLWCEVSPFGGIAGFPQTSTWLIQRDFLLEIPFTKGLKVLQDLDWLLHSYPHLQKRVFFINEPLAVFHNDISRARVTKHIDWQYSHWWAMENRQLFTRKALGFFLVIYCVNPAARQGASRTELSNLLNDCRQYGQITPKLVWLYFLYRFVYPWVSKVMSPRSRSIVLYKARTFMRRQK